MASRPRFEVVPYKIMGEIAYSIRDNQRGRFVAGANTAWSAEQKLKKLISESC